MVEAAEVIIILGTSQVDPSESFCLYDVIII